MRFCVDGRLDVLVNNAGVLASGPFTDMDVETHRRLVDVNVTGVIKGAVLGFPYLRRADRGCC
jgi:NADP-dependent 3-hydroxy acid dehydrogenase YdfG